MKLSGGMMVTLGFGVFLSVMAAMRGAPPVAGVLLIIYVLHTARKQNQAEMTVSYTHLTLPTITGV